MKLPFYQHLYFEILESAFLRHLLPSYLNKTDLLSKIFPAENDDHSHLSAAIKYPINSELLAIGFLLCP